MIVFGVRMLHKTLLILKSIIFLIFNKKSKLSHLVQTQKCKTKNKKRKIRKKTNWKNQNFKGNIWMYFWTMFEESKFNRNASLLNLLLNKISDFQYLFIDQIIFRLVQKCSIFQICNFQLSTKSNLNFDNYKLIFIYLFYCQANSLCAKTKSFSFNIFIK